MHPLTTWRRRGNKSGLGLDLEMSLEGIKSKPKAYNYNELGPVDFSNKRQRHTVPPIAQSHPHTLEVQVRRSNLVDCAKHMVGRRRQKLP